MGEFTVCMRFQMEWNLILGLGGPVRGHEAFEPGP